jgi:hypothetical protein
MRRRVITSRSEIEKVVRALGCAHGKGAAMYYALVKTGPRKLEELKWKTSKGKLVSGPRHLARMKSCLPFLKEAGLVAEKDQKLFALYKEIHFRIGENGREWRKVKGIENILAFIRKLGSPKRAYEKLMSRKYRFILVFG